MKIQIKKIVGVLLACAGLMTSTSCVDFEEINKNPYLPDKDMEQKDGVPICRIWKNISFLYRSKQIIQT